MNVRLRRNDDLNSTAKHTHSEFAGLNPAIGQATEYLLHLQYPEGYWWSELESNPTMEAEFLLLTHFLGIGDDNTWRKLSKQLLAQQRPDGTWGQFAPGDLSTSTECYFALKLAGVSPDEPMMKKARDFILSKGGSARNQGVHENLVVHVRAIRMERGSGDAAGNHALA